MTAEAHLSTAAEIGVRVIRGYQAGCDDPKCVDPLGPVWLDQRWMGWAGEFHEVWFQARADAVDHNLEKHPEALRKESATTWPSM